ncbi:hypothetical protein Scep_001505 [Stephania cephalantha]|uniref:Protein kinase domain-containing protein n=1 Tax=Stephania cephalantha TaxID=152367 RepID=A0AAP0Q541_9MAGN
MAVKSTMPIHSFMLRLEKYILTDLSRCLIDLSGCPQIINCYSDDTTVEDGKTIYNVFLEFAPNGDLPKHRAKNSHHNILIFPTQDGKKNDVKITDFRLAKRFGFAEKKNTNLGTPMYLSPESIALNDVNLGCDIWALGCVVAEMVTRRTAWKCDTDAEARSQLYRIGFTKELPEIPRELSEQGNDFLGKCWERDCSKRWTAEMLLKLLKKMILIRVSDRLLIKELIWSLQIVL